MSGVGELRPTDFIIFFSFLCVWELLAGEMGRWIPGGGGGHKRVRLSSCSGGMRGLGEILYVLGDYVYLLLYSFGRIVRNTFAVTRFPHFRKL